MNDQTTKPVIRSTSGQSLSTEGLGVIRTADVFGSGDGWLYSDGVDRDFGNNKMVTLTSGNIILSSVQPLKCDPTKCGLKLVGTIRATAPNETAKGIETA